MPRFFFDTDAGGGPRRDRDGLMLPDLAAAKDEAAGLLRDLSHGAPPDDSSAFSCAVRQDDGGAPVYRLTMRLEVQAV